MTEHILKIDGMTCGGCVASIERAFAQEAAVASLRISLDSGEAVFRTSLDPEQLKERIEALGFDVL